MAVYSSSCVLCSGNTSFDSTMSATFQALNYSWPYNKRAYFGNTSSDTMSFGGVLSLPQTEFGLIESGGDSSLSYLLYNGRLGVFPDPVNATAASEHFLSRLYATNQLLNPVIGMRFDPLSPKITIGALDENDYQGNLNWVPIITPNASWSFRNMFTLDGLKGYNGSVLPNSSATYATLDSVFVSVSIPELTTYLADAGYAGPINYTILPDGIVAYVCNSSEPYVALTATINGVDYPIDSTGNLVRSISSITKWGTCSVGLSAWDSSQPHINLGLPFLRSVYLAYRFPTDSCPGFYGFAFPSGNVNRTSSQIAQTPASTPTQSSQCLVFSSPTATPSPSFETVQQIQTLTQKYRVWGEQIMCSGLARWSDLSSYLNDHTTPPADRLRDDGDDRRESTSTLD
ncbi:acid protease [Boletus reticuloceps]|uniref:Acid protease n=1 Tax=Boletus reticuloceps TaxID=495285 RepID=A0A8I2YFB8_9AGAM|nr:acid protease [Boletus reticuloceps]